MTQRTRRYGSFRSSPKANKSAKSFEAEGVHRGDYKSENPLSAATTLQVENLKPWPFGALAECAWFSVRSTQFPVARDSPPTARRVISSRDLFSFRCRLLTSLEFIRANSSAGEGFLRILLVEDHPMQPRFSRKGFANTPMRSTSRATGGRALTRPSINDYDLILLDVMLPRPERNRGLPKPASWQFGGPRPDAYGP